MRHFGKPRGHTALAFLLSAAVVGACTESLDGGGNCAVASLLCPGQTVDIRDTIIDPTLEFDSTFVGFPNRGAELALPLVAHGDDFESVAVIRFDTLLTTYLPPGDTALPITYVDSSMVKLSLELTGAEVPDSVRLDLYDVGGDIAPDDTAAAPVLARFQPQFLIGGKTFAKTEFADSVFVPISDSAMLARILDTTAIGPRLRLGIRVSGSGPAAIRVGATEGGAQAVLRYRPKDDTLVHQLPILPASGGPRDRSDIRRDLLDYTLVLKNTLPTPAGAMMLGGVPGRRVYMLFNLPRRLTDSTTIIRATLRLNQLPYPFGGTTDTVVVNTHLVLAGPSVTDRRRAATLISGPGVFTGDSLIVLPGGSGLREIEMYPLVRAWGAQGSGPNVPPRAMVLATSNEGAFPRIVTFSSSMAAAGLRPRMRITYIPKTEFGVP